MTETISTKINSFRFNSHLKLNLQYKMFLVSSSKNFIRETEFMVGRNEWIKTQINQETQCNTSVLGNLERRD